MRTLAHEVIRQAAEAAGLPADRVTGQSAKDNATLPRPRVEVQYLTETFARTGRVLDRRREVKAPQPSVERDARQPSCESASSTDAERSARTLRMGTAEIAPPVQRTRRELYTVRLPVVAHVLADDEAWLDGFCPVFVAALPRGVNDARGLWVAVRVQRAEFQGYAERRVGNAVVAPFTKRSRLFTIDFTWRVATEEEVRLLTDINITPHVGGGN